MNFIPQIASAGLSLLGGPAGAISFGSSALQAFSQFSAGKADQREAEDQARQESLGAYQEIVRGRQGENEILDRLVDTLAQQRVAFAGSGTEVDVGTNRAIQYDTVARGEKAGRVTRDNSILAFRARRQRAAAYKATGKGSGLSGLIQAGTTIAGGVAKVLERG